MSNMSQSHNKSQIFDLRGGIQLHTFPSMRAPNGMTLEAFRISMATVPSPASTALAANVLVAVLSGAATASKSSIEVTPASTDL